jgi:hypothetical protein
MVGQCRREIPVTTFALRPPVLSDSQVTTLETTSTPVAATQGGRYHYRDASAVRTVPNMTATSNDQPAPVTANARR